jgi:hypothetical protein
MNKMIPKFGTVANFVTRITGICLTAILAMVYVPKVFSLESELVFVAMPLAIIFVILALYAQLASLVTYIRRIMEKN